MADDLKARVKALNDRIGKAMDGSDAVGNFVGSLLHAATIGHIMHFQTRSYAAHKALGELYEGLIDLTDDFAEAYQGCYGVIPGYPTTFAPMQQQEPVDFVRSLKAMVAASRTDLPSESQLQNIVDEIAALIDTALYKLTFLS
ncbi:hypothetical protein UFOVP233_56 [uncultured Caudovirales phage]|uniref:Uncharacterized protein n=1 Tax=uncultured Caudovirales phage TaxID=2100421 RepID=A0A6J7WU58_9CAUD|nr:hypothetical protein UFOVP233_56 [uncultured Caudovirales phage]